MKHAGKAGRAGLKLIAGSFVLLLIAVGLGYMAGFVTTAGSPLVIGLFIIWFLFVVFCVNFFRDPSPAVPADPKAVVSPAHGKVDIIDELEEKEFMGGRCKRISIFLSVADVHIQNAPIAGEVAYLKHTNGKFMNAMNTECASQNENVLIGFQSAERAGEKISLRLIAGLIARRIIPWAQVGDKTSRGERISLIQFGSRVDLYLPLDTQIAVKLGDRVKGGETIMARRP